MASRVTLKEWFFQEKKPQQSQFYDWFDSFFHKTEDTIAIEKVDGLQEALDSKQSVVLNGAPLTIANNTPGYIVIGDITTHYTFRIEYVIVRNTLREFGTILLENRANIIIQQESELDDCGLVFAKSIVGNELRLTYTDGLHDGQNLLLYITNLTKTSIPS